MKTAAAPPPEKMGPEVVASQHNAESLTLIKELYINKMKQRKTGKINLCTTPVPAM
jgi:hypothetical protein